MMRKSLVTVVLTGVVAGTTWVAYSQATKSAALSVAATQANTAEKEFRSREEPDVTYGRMLAGKGRLAEAEAVYRRALTLSPASRAEPRYDWMDGGPRDASHSKIDGIMRQFSATEDEAKKAELTKQLEGAVAESFDQDMKNREAELAKLEARLTKLRAQLERRRTAKDEITQLQVKVLINDAEGLGFSDIGTAGPLGPAASRVSAPALFPAPAPTPTDSASEALPIIPQK
jgi:hypothetical protein